MMIRILVILCLVGVVEWSRSAPAGSEPGTPLATVNQEVITSEDVAKYLSLTKVLIGEAQFNRQREALTNSAVSDLIDEHLIMGEFKRLGGVLNPKFIDSSIDDLVDRHYRASRERLKQALADEDVSMADLRKRIEEMIAVQALKSQQKGDAQGNVNAVEAWKQDLRNDAEIEITNEIPE